jgi:hypothetical protein
MLIGMKAKETVGKLSEKEKGLLKISANPLIEMRAPESLTRIALWRLSVFDPPSASKTLARADSTISSSPSLLAILRSKSAILPICVELDHPDRRQVSSN